MSKLMRPMKMLKMIRLLETRKSRGRNKTHDLIFDDCYYQLGTRDGILKQLYGKKSI